MIIRHADINDLDAIKRLADANKKELGFVVRSALTFGISKQWVLVAIDNDQVMGFVHYRHRRDSQTTIYELCVQADSRGQGIGRLLVKALQDESRVQGKTYILLKTPVDLPANTFYKHIGFVLAGQEDGRKRPLNVWKWEEQ